MSYIDLKRRSTRKMEMGDINWVVIIVVLCATQHFYPVL